MSSAVSPAFLSFSIFLCQVNFSVRFGSWNGLLFEEYIVSSVSLRACSASASRREAAFAARFASFRFRRSIVDGLRELLVSYTEGVVIAEKLTLSACLGRVRGLSAFLCLCLSTGLDPCRGRGADLDPDHACALSRGSTIGSCHVSVPGAHRLASCRFFVGPCRGRSLCRDPDRGACRLDPCLSGVVRGPSRSARRCACRRA